MFVALGEYNCHCLLLLFLHLLFFLLLLLYFLSLGFFVGLGRGVVARQRHVVAIPQLVELGGFVLAAAGAAVPETGQRGTYLHAFDCHRALDGLTELGRERREKKGMKNVVATPASLTGQRSKISSESDQTSHATNCACILSIRSI